MLDDDEEKFWEVVSTIGFIILCMIGGLLFLSASVWVLETFF